MGLLEKKYEQFHTVGKLCPYIFVYCVSVTMLFMIFFIMTYFYFVVLLYIGFINGIDIYGNHGTSFILRDICTMVYCPGDTRLGGNQIRFYGKENLLITHRNSISSKYCSFIRP